jgi:glyoxylase-like metal-dependent hydrolase (beta-lactamase superfamily II)
VVAIFLTHGHADHTGGARMFPRAQVMALEREVALVEGREGATGPLLRLMPVTPTGISVRRKLRDGESVVVGDVSVRVFATPGHTAGSASYLVNGVLFVGDSADVASDGRLVGSPWIFSDSQAGNVSSLVRLDQRLRQDGVDVTAIAPAHSGVLTDGLTQLDIFAREHASE